MQPKRAVLIVSAIAAVLIISLLVLIARHSLAGTWSGSYSGTTPMTISLILNRNRTGDLLVTPLGTEKMVRWKRHGQQVLLFEADAQNAAGTPFATGVVSDRSDVLNLSLASEMVDPHWTGGKATVVLKRERKR
jgi:hypothetical protein